MIYTSSMAFESERADLKKFQKPVMLKDFLLNSSSSNGFASFPRRAADSSTVRKLLDLGAGGGSSQGKMQTPMPRSRSTGLCAASALRWASETVINAVKHIPFYSVMSPSYSARSKRASSLRRSLSQRLKRRFRKKKKTDVARCKSCSCRDEEEEDSKGSPLENSSCSWLESDWSSAQSSSGSSEYFGGNEGLFGKNDQLKSCCSRRIERDGVDEDSTDGETKEQVQQEQKVGRIAGLYHEKEQLSPVSLLDGLACVDEESASPTSPIKGEIHSNQIHQQLGRFRIASQMRPTNLCNEFFCGSEMEEEESEKATAKAQDLLNCFRANHGKAAKGWVAIDRLMLDFFREGCRKGEEKLLLRAASIWMRRDGGTGLSVEDNKEAYVEGMAEGGRYWRCFAVEEDEFVLEMEAWLLISMLEELMLDLL